MIRLDGKRALVTGGSRGIGQATALLLARAGADVAVAYRARGDEADRVVEAIAGMDQRAVAVAGDLGDPHAARAVVDRTIEALGGLDIVVANHGIWPAEETALGAMAETRWRETIATNLDAVFFVIRAAVGQLDEDGSVVIVSSTAGQRGEAFHADYAATKGALISLTKSLAVELAPAIRVNAVAPGWVDTEMSEPAYAGGGLARIAATIPLRRVAAPDDIAGPIVFLCSDLARHITGEILNVNGGSVLCG